MAVRSTPWAQVIQSQSFASPCLFKTIEEEAIGQPLAGRWDDAIDVNIRGVDIDYNNQRCWNRLGKAYLELSKYKDPRVSLERALAIDLHNRVVTRQLERLSNLNSN